VNRASATVLKPPLSVPDRDWRPLAQRWDRRFQASLGMALKQHPLWQSLIGQQKMAVGLVDLSDPKRPRFAKVNGDAMMYAASLPKIAVLLAAFQGFEEGTLRETPQMRTDLIEMIRRSDNFAASRVINQVGLRRIAAVIQDPRYRFYDQNKGGGLWVGSDYGLHLEQNPEPLKNLNHAATVNQVCRFYYLLAYGRLINLERSRQMLKIMAFPDLNDKFVRALGGAVPLNHLYRKSGEYKTWYSDSILVWNGAGRRYILVALVEDAQGENILRQLLPAMEQSLSCH
jgi:beta-lactamase class A